MRKIILNIILISIFLLGINNELYSQKKTYNQLQCEESSLSVTVSNDVDLGNIARGASRDVTGVIKFIITGANNNDDGHHHDDDDHCENDCHHDSEHHHEDHHKDNDKHRDNTNDVYIKNYATNGKAADVLITTEWKMGSATGYENVYSNGTRELCNGKYYVTMKVTHIAVGDNAALGGHSFEQILYVEYTGM
jgi:hypothetical protein